LVLAVLLASYPWLERPNTSARYVGRAGGYPTGMERKDDGRTLEQEVATGESEATPFIALSAVVAVVAALVVVALLVVVLAYALA
jgi:hypothetical protein